MCLTFISSKQLGVSTVAFSDACLPLCALVCGCFFPSLPGLGFAGRWHASLRLAPYSPAEVGIPDEWYGHRRRRPQTRSGAFPFKHGLMTTDRFRLNQRLTAESRRGVTLLTGSRGTVTDGRGQTGHRSAPEAEWSVSSQRTVERKLPHLSAGTTHSCTDSYHHKENYHLKCIEPSKSVP